MPDTNTLSIEPRAARSKQNRALRSQEQVPAVIYGHRVEPVSVSLPRREFERAFHRVGRTQLLDLQVGGEGKPRKVLVREVQYNPRNGGLVHVDFYQVNLKEKITADVPVVLVGESPAVQRKDGEILHNLHSLRISVLPADIPEHFEVDVTSLEAVDDAIHVSDIAVADGIEVLTVPEEVVVKVTPIRDVAEEEAAEAAEAAEGEAEEAAPAGEAQESEAGEAATES